MQNLSLVLSKLTPDSEETLQLAREAAERRLLVHGADHQETFDGWRDLGLVLDAAGHHEEALEYMRRALSGQQRVFGFQTEKARSIMDNLCKMMEKQGNTKAAEELRKEHASQTVASAEAAPKPRERAAIVAFVLCVYVLPEY